MSDITPDDLLEAYANGYFPMAEGRHDDAFFWIEPEERGVIPLDTFNIPRGLRKTLRDNPFTIRVDSACEEVIIACANSRRETWINDEIIELYSRLHHRGHVHSVECWQDNALVGGLYGVSIGAVFCGESMFSRTSQASKVALVHLVEILNEAGYTLLDTQFVNDHLKQFGVQAIPQADYMKKLESALKVEPNPSSLFSTVSLRKGWATGSNSNST
ncbi:MAG: leucyl/phenylalanyl-tRNA--protein transferase [Rickettsiales bacterium]|nr:leucyl/phenylalanyl-tRNA--protein transferase [Rickettsiales bacterium]